MDVIPMSHVTIHPPDAHSHRLARSRRQKAPRGWLCDLKAALAAVGAALGEGLAHIIVALATAYLLQRFMLDVPHALH